MQHTLFLRGHAEIRGVFLLQYRHIESNGYCPSAKAAGKDRGDLHTRYRWSMQDVLVLGGCAVKLTLASGTVEKHASCFSSSVNTALHRLQAPMCSGIASFAMQGVLIWALC